MITKEEIIRLYYDDYDYTAMLDGIDKVDDKTKAYREKLRDTLEEFDVLGGEEDGDYDAHVYVLLRKKSDGVLYDWYDSHCSCNGYEGFKPEETTLEALWLRTDQYVKDALIEAGLQKN